jgi:hypothetical protein
MSASGSQDRGRFTRHTVSRHRGISYRRLADGTRSYYVYWDRKYLPAGTMLQEALAKQGELRSRKARGERVVAASKRTVREVGNEWHEAEKGRWKKDYAVEMRRCLDREIFPEFGDDRLASIGPREVVAYDRKLRARGLSQSGAANVMKPLRGLLDHAVLCGDISQSPYRQVPKGKLSSCNTRRQHHEWTTEQIDTFIATAYAFGNPQPDSEIQETVATASVDRDSKQNSPTSSDSSQRAAS